jgi:pyruvate kinase
MLHETQRAMAPALHELLSTVSALRDDVHAESEELYNTWQSRIERSAFVPSAQNLAAYLALRRRDLRSLQASLMRWGLSSLGRSESRVIATLDAVVASLGAICAATRTDAPDYPDEQQMFAGANTIAQAADAIFGRFTRARDTRIMVTLPTEAGEEPRFLRTLLQQGIECVRINCAHDDPDVWTAMLTNLREAEQAVGRTEPVRVLMDLGGPKVRTVRPRKAGKERFGIGDTLLLAHRVKRQNAHEPARVGCTLPEILAQLQPGAQVWIDDGAIGARVMEKVGDDWLLEVLQAPPDGKKIRADKGLNFPDTALNIGALTEKDRDDLAFIVQHADMVGYSFVQTANDVMRLEEELTRWQQPGRPAPAIVLKIETKQAVRHLPELIVQAAGHWPTAVMIARGDLAVEIGYNRMAEMQEEILWLCEAAHVPVIWATQVLESLAKEGVPSRAEVTDAAMAVRAECVMLNKGPFITEAVQLLDDVLTRMLAHQQKKTAQLRALHSWQNLFEG